MAAAKHTPGPWHYRRGDEWSHSVVTHHGVLPDGSPNCWSIADINKNREPEHEANARLIAAAPTMLAALQDALVFCEQQEDVRDGPEGEQLPNAAMSVATNLRAAIAKATGEAA